MEYKEYMMHRIYHRILTAAAMLTLLLGSWRGHVALFSEEGQQPLELYPVRLELLPVADRDLLQKGIPVKDADELMRILEDLLS